MFRKPSKMDLFERDCDFVDRRMDEEIEDLRCGSCNILLETLERTHNVDRERMEFCAKELNDAVSYWRVVKSQMRAIDFSSKEKALESLVGAEEKGDKALVQSHMLTLRRIERAEQQLDRACHEVKYFKKLFKKFQKKKSKLEYQYANLRMGILDLLEWGFFPEAMPPHLVGKRIERIRAILAKKAREQNEVKAATQNFGQIPKISHNALSPFPLPLDGVVEF